MKDFPHTQACWRCCATVSTPSRRVARSSCAATARRCSTTGSRLRDGRRAARAAEHGRDPVCRRRQAGEPGARNGRPTAVGPRRVRPSQQLSLDPQLLKRQRARDGRLWMAGKPELGVVRPDGRHWQVDNLSVHDGSLFPTSIGANPQLSVYGLANKLATQLASELSGRSVPCRWPDPADAGAAAAGHHARRPAAGARCGATCAGTAATECGRCRAAAHRRRLRRGAGAGVCIAAPGAWARRPHAKGTSGAVAAAWWARGAERAAGVLLAAALSQPALARPPARRRARPAWCAAGARLRLQPRPVEPLAAAPAPNRACPLWPSTWSRCSAASTTTSRILEDAVRRLESATGLPPVIVAHSMGGLALRRWWAEHGDDSRVHHAVTIGTRTTAPGWRDLP
jgi:hypothetical protein